MDETAPTATNSDLTGQSGVSATPSEGFYSQPVLTGPGRLDLGKTSTFPDQVAQSISAGAEALGLPSTLPTADTAPAPVENSQAGLAGARTRLGAPTEDASGAFGGPEILKSVLIDAARRDSEQPIGAKQAWDMEVREAGIQRINDKLADAQRPAQAAAMPSEPKRPQGEASRQADLVAAEAANIAKAKLNPDEFRTSTNPKIEPQTT